jgi:hypothetical protein
MTDPICAKWRQLILDPIAMLSNTLKQEPNRTPLKSENLLPERIAARTDMDDPKEVNPNTDT